MTEREPKSKKPDIKELIPKTNPNIGIMAERDVVIDKRASLRQADIVVEQLDGIGAKTQVMTAGELLANEQGLGLDAIVVLSEITPATLQLLKKYQLAYPGCMFIFQERTILATERQIYLTLPADNVSFYSLDGYQSVDKLREQMQENNVLTK